MTAVTKGVNRVDTDVVVRRGYFVDDAEGLFGLPGASDLFTFLVELAGEVPNGGLNILAQLISARFLPSEGKLAIDQFAVNASVDVAVSAFRLKIVYQISEINVTAFLETGPSVSHLYWLLPLLLANIQYFWMEHG